jgi:ribosomal protein S15P/S13E
MWVFEGGKAVNNEHTQQADDPSGPGWRDVGPDEILQTGDMFETPGKWCYTVHTGLPAAKGGGGPYRRRIEPHPEANQDDPSGESCRQALAACAGRMISVCGHLSDYGDSIQESQQVNKEQQQAQQATDDPSGDGWVWVAKGDTVREGDMWRSGACSWCRAERVGETVQYKAQYRRRIEQPQPSDSEPETMEQLRDEVATLTFELMAERDSGMIALQQLQEQVATLTRERDRLQSSLRDHHKDGQQALAGALQTWLRPVLELVAEHPEDCGPLAVSILGYLPGIASRLIEE